METTLKHLCDKHKLSAITVTLIPKNGDCSLSVFVHWDEMYEGKTEGKCASANGAPFYAALDAALREMFHRRTAEAT